MRSKHNANPPPRLDSLMNPTIPVSLLIPRQEQPRVHAVGPRQAQRGADPSTRRIQPAQVPNPHTIHTLRRTTANQINHLVRHHHRQPKPPGQRLQPARDLEKQGRPAPKVQARVLEIGPEQSGNRIDHDDSQGKLGPRVQQEQLNLWQRVEQLVCGVDAVDEYTVAGVSAEKVGVRGTEGA